MGNTTELERDRVETESEFVEARKMSKGEERVVERLRRARLVAKTAAPELNPSLEDLIDLSELISDEGG
ncbi:MAG: hypothetical protein Q8P41_03885 [Pseudomonadota bacterium]|nr:hypothetical protein [Pseudomonadota bacterium]